MSESILHLIIRHLRGQQLPGDKELLDNWIYSSDSNKKFFLQLESLWKKSGLIQELEPSDIDAEWKKFISTARSKTGSRKLNSVWNAPWFIPAAAASLIVAFTLGGLAHYLFSSTPESITEFVVPKGSKSIVYLPDSSEVWINSGSTLRFSQSYGKSERNVFLVGEAYFKVRSNPSATFYVHTTHLKVQSIGTEFNVKAYPEEKQVETILVKGKIKVFSNLKAKDLKEAGILMKPHQRLIYFPQTQKMTLNLDQATYTGKQGQDEIKSLERIPGITVKETESNPVILTSWKDKRWEIEAEDLTSLARKLERKYDVQITFKSEELHSLRFSGTLESESLEQVLYAISLSSPIEYSVNGNQVELRKNEKFGKQYKELYHK